MYECETQGVVVQAEPTYCTERSRPRDRRFVWTYAITIENRSEQTVQLLTRRWRITDAAGLVQTVSGPGVVGVQPVLRPGESFAYESAAPLATPSGVMAGSYEMKTGSGEIWEVAIPAFSLDSPHEPARTRPN